MIYIIDDNKIMLFMYTSLLEGRCKTFTSYTELLKSCAVESPEYLITDVSMPEISGYEVAENISRLYPAVKIIVATCYKEHKHKISQLGYMFWNKENIPQLEEMLNG